MIPGLQIVGAALLSIPLRANIPIAAAMTFLSNPATTPFFLIAAIALGNKLGFHADLAPLKRSTPAGRASRWLDWLLSDAAPAMITGLFLIAAGMCVRRLWSVDRRLALVDQPQVAQARAT
jgi:uncharacterized protein (DUF2062 family)